MAKEYIAGRISEIDMTKDEGTGLQAGWPPGSPLRTQAAKYVFSRLWGLGRAGVGAGGHHMLIP